MRGCAGDVGVPRDRRSFLESTEWMRDFVQWFVHAGVCVVGLILFVLVPCTYAQGGHGPVFGLQTPTLPQGAWNVDGTLMAVTGDEAAVMARQTTRYGVTPHVQLNLSVPLMLQRAPNPPNTRVGTMMGGLGDAEVSVLWRVHRQYLGVGKRFESSVLVGALAPVYSQRGNVRVGPGVHAGAVTGYASRSVYAWIGGGVQRYLERDGDRPGTLGYVSAVAAWRPPVFRGDYPKPDWRVFVESLAEFTGSDRVDGVPAESGGTKVFVGPTVLGLYGAWGIGAGVLFPAYQDLESPNINEHLRMTLNLSYWF